MAEQQLVDYIKKARNAGQADGQTHNLLYKNGWTTTEVGDAFAVIEQSQVVNQPKPELEPQVQPQSQPQPIIISQPKIEPQPQVDSQPQQPKIEAQPQVDSQPQQPKITNQPDGPRGASQNDMPQIKTKSHPVFKILMVLIIVVVLGGVGYFAAGQYLNLPCSDFLRNLFAPNPNPQTVISNMLTNMKNVKSSHITMQAEFNATDNSSKTSQGELAFNTNFETDMIDANNPKADGNFTINLILPGSASPVVLSNVIIAAVDNVFYFKINDIVILDTYLSALSASYHGLDISQIKGKWFKVDQDSIKALSEAQGAVINVSQTNNSELAKVVQDLVAAENMFSVNKQLNGEVISGQDTYHYLITISKEKLKDLITKMITLGTQEASKLQNGATNSSTSLVENMAEAFVSSFTDAIGDINMEMWIGKKDYMLYQTKVDKAIDLSKIFPGVNMQLEVKFNSANSNFNKPITVQAPEGSQKIEDVVLPLLKIQTTDLVTQKIQSDMSQIESLAQLSFTTAQSYYSLCSHGLLNGYLETYGKELVDLNNDIVSQGAKKPVCLSSVQDYCVSTQLADESYLCINKSGVLGKTKCISAQTVCQ